MSDAPPPIPMVYQGEGVFRALPPHQRTAEAHYGRGEIMPMVPWQERSPKSHRHYFCMIKEAWQNLREDDAARFPTQEHLRKWALIKAGYYNRQDIACATRAEALRWLPVLAAAQPYTVVIATATIVSVFTAKSQSHRAMPRGEFQKSKDDVLQIVSDMIAVTPAALAERAKAA